MPKLEGLKTLAGQDYDPTPPVWPLVHYLMIEFDAPGRGDLGATVAASGEVSVFSYARDSIAPIYFGTVGGSQRLKTCTGYETKGLRTTDAEKAFALIREGVDAGKAVFVAGPEIGLCCGYDIRKGADDREVYGISNWGPAFNGTFSWLQFSKLVEAFGGAEGFAYLKCVSESAPAESIVEEIAATVIDWQKTHPATSIGMKQEYYGLTAFGHFIRDIRDPETRAKIDEAYINCHVIRALAGGRYWLSQYLTKLASHFTGDVHQNLIDISDLYLETYSGLKKFIDFNVIEGKNENEVQRAADWLDDAFCAEKRILEKFRQVREML